MKLIITTEAEEVFELEVHEELDVETLQALCEIETGIPSGSFHLIHNGRFLSEGKAQLSSLSICDGDCLLLFRVTPNDQCSAVQSSLGLESHEADDGVPAAAAAAPLTEGAVSCQADVQESTSRLSPTNKVSEAFASLSEERRRKLVQEAATLREALLSRPEEVAILQERNPLLAEALVTGDAAAFAAVLHFMRCCQDDRQQQDHQQQQRLQRNLLDPRVQEMIAEEIRQKNVDANRAAAAEFTPEVFAKVNMLFVPVRINGHLVKAFVDTGAQTTLINVPCAKRCDLMHLLDRSYSGVAYGVGTQRIIGRVHVANLQLGVKDFLPSSFNVVENEPLEMMLGLDTLKRHRCKIDLDENALIIGSSGSRVPFLEGRDLPDLSGVARKDDDEIMTAEGFKDVDRRTRNEEAEMNFADVIRQMKATGFEEEGRTTDGRMDVGAQLPADRRLRGLAQNQQNEPMQPQNEQLALRNEQMTPQNQRVNDRDLEEIVGMGFDRSLARQELLDQSGDVNQAIAALLAKSLSFG